MGRTNQGTGPKANKKGGGGKFGDKGGGRGGKKFGGPRRGGGKGRPPSSNSHRPRKKVEISFDPTSRREYLTGFATRKKERRAFGLAMQKVKDRRDKLEDRKEQREARLGEIEDIERNKKALRKGGDDGGDSDDEGNDPQPQNSGEKETKTFQDEHTALQFGGTVSVTTTFGIPSDDEASINSSSEFYARPAHDKSHVDVAQRKAGNVNSYMAEVKGTLGSKKKHAQSGGGRKGQHGASSMKGMGNGTSLKVAKRALAKFKAKGGKGADADEGRRGGGKGGRNKRKGRR